MYNSPTPEDLIKLREELGLTQAQMAEFAKVAGGNQWRKYTGGNKPRSMSFHILFYIATKLILNDEQLDAIYKKMQDIGAEIDER